MSKYISEERLRELIQNDDYYDSGIEKAVIYGLIANECRELNPWLPIENAPKDRPVFLWNGKSKCIGYWLKDGWLIVCWFGVDHSLDFISYQELPDDPENQESGI